MVVSVETFRKVALEDGDAAWEYHCGRLVRKPPMTTPHNERTWELARQLGAQLDPDHYSVRMNAGHLRVAGNRFVVPDIVVLPRSYVLKAAERPYDLEEYSQPLPFVAEVWSRSTGDYDVEEKFPAYRERGDREIWRVHPYEKTVTAWRLQPSGEYVESVHRSGSVAIASLPGVEIDLERLFRY
jgi:Uma2 family endonuclease